MVFLGIIFAVPPKLSSLISNPFPVPTITDAERAWTCRSFSLRLALKFDGTGLVGEAYKDGSGGEHGIYQTYKLALYLYALQNTGTNHYGEEKNSLGSQDPDDGFQTSHDQGRTYAGPRVIGVHTFSR